MAPTSKKRILFFI